MSLRMYVISYNASSRLHCCVSKSDKADQSFLSAERSSVVVTVRSPRFESGTGSWAQISIRCPGKRPPTLPPRRLCQSTLCRKTAPTVSACLTITTTTKHAQARARVKQFRMLGPICFYRRQLEYDAGGGMQLIERIPPPETQPNEKRPETTPNRNGTRFQPGQPAPTQCIRQVLLTCSGTTPSETQRKTCTNYELQVVACQEGPRPRTKGGRGGRRRRPRHCQEVTG